MKKGENIQEAAALIRKGGLVVFPTETVYGLGADAFNSAAVRKIFEVKKRPFFNPLIVHIARIEDLELLCSDVTELVLELAGKFWPGPLTLVLQRKATVPDIVTAGLPTVAVRMPAHPIALELIRKSCTPIAAPSANMFGCLSPTETGHVEKQLDYVDYILDGGRCPVGIESTVLAVNNKSISILRPGAVTADDLKEYNLLIPENPGQGEVRFQSPGLLKSHYSPKKPLYIINDLINIPAGAGLIVFTNPQQKIDVGKLEVLSPGGCLSEAAANLFPALHRLEESEVESIYVRALPETGLGVAIMDRLRKAAYKFSQKTACR